MIETFYKDTATLVRRTTANATATDTLVTIGSFVGLLRPVDDVSKLYNANNIGKEYDFVCDDSNTVIVGDNLYVSGNKYGVIGVTLYEDLENSEDTYINLRITR